MLEEVVTSIQDKAVLAIVSGSLATVKSKLDEAAAIVGLSSTLLQQGMASFGETKFKLT